MRKLRSIFDKMKKTNASMLITAHLELPRITMIGDIHVYIENHHGIVKFTSTEIILNISSGQLVIKGRGLVIKMLLTAEMLVEGKITSLEMNHRTDKNGVES